jgi:hypothetical protein
MADRVVVGLALDSDRYIVTEDSDFGKGSSIKASEHRDVLDFLTARLGLTVHDATEACSWLVSLTGVGSA